MGLSASVPLPIVMGIFVLLGFQSSSSNHDFAHEPKAEQEILWPGPTINFNLKTEYILRNFKYKLIAQRRVPATTGRLDADILNGSCDVWGSRDFLPYILYNLL